VGAIFAASRGTYGSPRVQTHGIERDHARQRHWLARFRRRSIVVSRALRMVEASIALFARFGGNDGIADLLAIRA
jgi:insertion element IS1 protein InsB